MRAQLFLEITKSRRTNENLQTMVDLVVRLSKHIPTPDDLRAYLEVRYPGATRDEVLLAMLRALNQISASASAPRNAG